ncbi:hypothetical protein GCM10010215_26150 [Streptomyces virginiae]|uniref:Uncharacterized protein n=1 Tax=Streptomyces virginiae TaxID=1961 RepID=A0ABQ3NN62_STRVG|nr:hypothetical protein GCM10010215_26150 [Streptomyces virginiae]GHI14206.1 hypothetical protein Scinn_36690 [Streptomyces virginiae]
MFAPFSIERDANGSIECASRVFYDDGDDGRKSRKQTYEEAEGIRCAVARDPADMLGLLLLSLPFAATGIFQYTSRALALPCAITETRSRTSSPSGPTCPPSRPRLLQHDPRRGGAGLGCGLVLHFMRCRRAPGGTERRAHTVPSACNCTTRTAR